MTEQGPRRLVRRHERGTHTHTHTAYSYDRPPTESTSYIKTEASVETHDYLSTKET